MKLNKLFLSALALGAITVSCEKDELEALTSTVNANHGSALARDNGLSQEIKALDARITAALMAEESARQAGDAELADLLAESVARLEDLLSAEEAARILGDSDLQDALDLAVNQLSDAISSEEAARIKGDDQLQVALSAAVVAINKSIDAEELARTNGDIRNTQEIITVRAQLSSAIAQGDAAAIQTAADALEAAVEAQGIVDAGQDSSIVSNTLDIESNDADIAALGQDLTAAIASLGTQITNGDNALSNRLTILRNDFAAAVVRLDAAISGGDATVANNAAAALTAAVQSINDSSDVTEGQINGLITALTSRVDGLEGVSASYDSSTGVLTITLANGSTYVTGDLRGSDGEDGQNGQGATGATGAAGADGIAGEDGTDGAQGAQGPQGEQGQTGPAGPSGTDAADTHAITGQAGGVESFENSPLITEYSYDGGDWGSIGAAQAAARLSNTTTTTTVQIQSRTIQNRLRSVTAIFNRVTVTVVGDVDDALFPNNHVYNGTVHTPAVVGELVAGTPVAGADVDYTITITADPNIYVLGTPNTVHGDYVYNYGQNAVVDDAVWNAGSVDNGGNGDFQASRSRTSTTTTEYILQSAGSDGGDAPESIVDVVTADETKTITDSYVPPTPTSYDVRTYSDYAPAFGIQTADFTQTRTVTNPNGNFDPLIGEASLTNLVTVSGVDGTKEYSWGMGNAGTDDVYAFSQAGRISTDRAVTEANVPAGATRTIWSRVITTYSSSLGGSTHTIPTYVIEGTFTGPVVDTTPHDSYSWVLSGNTYTWTQSVGSSDSATDMSTPVGLPTLPNGKQFVDNNFADGSVSIEDVPTQQFDAKDLDQDGNVDLDDAITAGYAITYNPGLFGGVSAVVTINTVAASGWDTTFLYDDNAAVDAAVLAHYIAN